MGPICHTKKSGPNLSGPNLPQQKISGAQFAAKKRLGPNLPRTVYCHIKSVTKSVTLEYEIFFHHHSFCRSKAICIFSLSINSSIFRVKASHGDLMKILYSHSSWESYTLAQGASSKSLNLNVQITYSAHSSWSSRSIFKGETNFHLSPKIIWKSCIQTEEASSEVNDWIIWESYIEADEVSLVSIKWAKRTRRSATTSKVVKRS